jgi:hypothetical protein
VYVSAESKEKIDNIVFDNVDVFINKTTLLPGGVYDRRPSEAEGFVKGSTSGFYFDTVTDMLVRNCSVKWGTKRPDYFTYALETHNITHLKISGFDGKSAFPQKMPTQYNR